MAARPDVPAAGGRSPADRHVPVLLARVVELLAPAVAGADAVVLDATLGMGGHSAALLDRFPRLRVVGLDRDPQALDLAARRLRPYAERTTLVHAVYDRLAQVLREVGTPRVQGVLFDLGVSSLQLDSAERGFAYAHEAPLDMRMDPGTTLTAAEVVNTYPVDRLARVLSQYGEERFARRIAAAIDRRRRERPLSSTAELAELVRASIPAATRRTGGHPAKRTFQALRIEVNGELAALERALPAALDALALHGRIVVLAYHSLEDRLVKRALVGAASSTAPPGLPVVPARHEPVVRLLTRGAERPGPEELATNPRAASARLRAAEKIREAA